MEWAKLATQKIYDNNNQIIPELRGIFSFNGVDIWLADGGVSLGRNFF